MIDRMQSIASRILYPSLSNHMACMKVYRYLPTYVMCGPVCPHMMYLHTSCRDITLKLIEKDYLINIFFYKGESKRVSIKALLVHCLLFK